MWYSTMTDTIARMRSVEQQVAAGIVAGASRSSRARGSRQVLTAAVTGAVLLLVLLLTFIVARSLVDPLRRLQADALEIATKELPAGSPRSARPRTRTSSLEVEPISVHSTDEIGKVARAFDQVHHEAVRLAGNEAMLRGSLNAMFISLSRRSVPLIERLTRMIDSLEQNEDDPDRLSNLFSMDHLVTRMRRNSENLLVLAGEEPVRKWSEPVPLTDVARAATSEIEQYGRVVLNIQPEIVISGQAASDIVHLLAELIENATMFSPRDTAVHVSGQEISTGGVLLEVRDSGVGVSSTRLDEMNWRLDNPPRGRRVGIPSHGPVRGVAARRAARDPGPAARRRRHRDCPPLSGCPAASPAGRRVRHAEPPVRRAGRGVRGRGAAESAGGALRGGTAWDCARGRRRASWTAAARVRRRRPGHGGRGGRGGPGSPTGSAPSARQARPHGDGDAAAAAGAWLRHAEHHGPARHGHVSAGTARRGYERAGGTWDAFGAHSWPGGWRIAETVSTPARGDRTAAGLPTRVPGANLFPGSASRRRRPGTRARCRCSARGRRAVARAAPRPSPQPRRSPEMARSRLSGFQLGSREAEDRDIKRRKEGS